MANGTIKLNEEQLNIHLTKLEDYVRELSNLAPTITALPFGVVGRNESAGPCAEKANEINYELDEICIAMARLIHNSVKHLRGIAQDLIDADEA